MCSDWCACLPLPAQALLWMLQRPGVTLRVDERGNAYALHGAAQAGSQEVIEAVSGQGAALAIIVVRGGPDIS